MTLRKTAAIFSLIAGISIIVVWALMLITGKDAQLQDSLRTEPLAIGLHLAAEFITAIMLIIAGITILVKHSRAMKLFIFALGMLVYSVVNSSGFYAQRGDITFVLMFVIIFILTGVFAVFAYLSRSKKDA